MNNIMKSLVAFFASVIVFTACGGGGGGTTTSGAQTGSFTKEVAYAGVNSFAGNNPSERQMNLYLAADIKGSGMINSVSIKHANAISADVTCSSFTLRMGHTNVSSLTATFANNIEQGQGSLQTVRSGSITIPAGPANAYFSIPLSQPFNYNGVDNLVVDAAYSGCTGTVNPLLHQTSSYNGFVLGAPGAATVGVEVDASVTDAKFNFAGGNDFFVPQTGSVNVNNWPFNANPLAGRKVQMLYTKDEINGSGPITGIGFPVGSVTSAQQFTVNIRLGHSTLTTLGTTFANNFSSTPVTVANNKVFIIPAGVPAGSFLWLPIPDGAFTYDGTDSLVMEIEVTDNSSATTGVDWRINNGYSRYVKLGGDLGASTGSVSNYAHYAKFRFAGGTVDVITAGGTSDTFPFSNNNDNKQQYLYRAAELGTKGNIVKVACRLNVDSSASNYQNFSVVLGHTTKTALDATFSTNLSDAQAVYSGTFSVPAGLRAGDWIEIPLSAPFAYDGTRNLVIQMSTLKGTAQNCLRLQNDAARYSGRNAWTNVKNTTDTASSVDANLDDLRLVIQ